MYIHTHVHSYSISYIQVVSQSLVGSTPPHGFRKVLVKPIAPKQNLPTGIQTVGSVTGFGQVPHTSLPTSKYM